MSVLDVWGLDDGTEAVYRTLLRNPGRDAAWLARHLERGPGEVRGELDALIRVGLARREGRAYAAGPPATTVQPLLHRELSDLDGRRAQLDAVRASLASFAADHFVGQSRSWAEVPFELLSDAEAVVAFEDLQRSTRGEVLSCHAVGNIDAMSPPYVELLHRQLRAGRPMRGLYPSDVVEDADRLAYVREWVAAGETVRLTRADPPQVVVFGDEVALVTSGSGEGRILVRAPAIVALVSDLFERYWDRAVPLYRTAAPAAADDRAEILEGLMLGAKDEALARQLGVSLRTVRRRVAELMDELNASTRFQAGMEAVRRGLL